MNLPNDTRELRAQHFPLFVTVKKLVNMIDASAYNSFFTRTRERKSVGMAQSLSWHGEDQGVFMINQDFKNGDDLQKKVQNFELALLAGEEIDDGIDQVEYFFNAD